MTDKNKEVQAHDQIAAHRYLTAYATLVGAACITLGVIALIPQSVG